MKKDNILIIMCDQLTWKALPAYGNTFIKTPNIDRIADNSVIFDNCYTPYPLCQPARAAIWSGLLPHQNKIESNGKLHEVPPFPQNLPTLGSIFTEAGYETAHFGKNHSGGALRGFYIEPEGKSEVKAEEPWPISYDTENDRYTTQKAIEYLQKKSDKPFLMVVDLQNPHDICNWIGHNIGTHIDKAVDGTLPELPDNFMVDDMETRPKPVQYICCSHNRQCQAVGWTKENYQHYLAAYYHYISRLDAEIGLILDTLEKRDDFKETLIIFTADHGDSMAARGMVTKQVSFYEETVHVPMFIKGGRNKQEGKRIDSLVSTMDLIPTLCEYAQIPYDMKLWGKSMMPLILDKQNEIHSYVVSQWLTEWGHTMEPGRMIRSSSYKYMKYREEKAEELYNLSLDPGEKVNLINMPEYKEVLEKHREILEKYIKETEDNFNTLEFENDKRWRSHKAGFHNHTGPAAPMV